MNVKDLIVFLHHIKCWIPKSNLTIRAEIEALIENLKRGM
jgi:hypothetical protein